MNFQKLEKQQLLAIADFLNDSHERKVINYRFSVSKRELISELYLYRKKVRTQQKKMFVAEFSATKAFKCPHCEISR